MKTAAWILKRARMISLQYHLCKHVATSLNSILLLIYEFMPFTKCGTQFRSSKLTLCIEFKHMRQISLSSIVSLNTIEFCGSGTWTFTFQSIDTRKYPSKLHDKKIGRFVYVTYSRCRFATVYFDLRDTSLAEENDWILFIYKFFTFLKFSNAIHNPNRIENKLIIPSHHLICYSYDTI